MNDLEQRWASLAAQVNARMQLRALTPSQLAERAGYSVETIRPVHAGRVASLRPATKAAVARALGWSGDSIDLILNGEAPVVVDATDDEQLRETVARMAEALTDLEDRVRDLEAQVAPTRKRVATTRIDDRRRRWDAAMAAESGEPVHDDLLDGATAYRGEGAESEDPNPAGL